MALSLKVFHKSLISPIPHPIITDAKNSFLIIFQILMLSLSLEFI